MARRSRRTRELTKALEVAESYAMWRHVASELDELEGGAAWRARDESSHYDAASLRASLAALQAARRGADPMGLAEQLHVGLHRHLAEITDSTLYVQSRVGTKHLIEQYLDAAVDAIEHLAAAVLPGVPPEAKRAIFAREAHNVGRTALLLSGGATLGLFHIGVVRALWREDLLPTVVSGASTGSMIAGGLCTRTDAELEEVFADPTEHVYTRVFRLLGPRELSSERVVMAREQLLHAIRSNMHDLTFREAWERTGRVLCMTVSPTRARQKPRLLNHETAPDVLVTSASLASCAIPGMFPPSTLLQRVDGEESEYVAGERWIDGTVQSDLPKARLARLLNVNHTIVSQTNAHVLPFVQTRQQGGALPLVADLLTSSAYATGLQALAVARRHAKRSVVKRALARAHGVADQGYMGDITIFPRVTPWNYGVVLRNASKEALARLVRQGERATWERMHVIRAQTRVSRALDACVRGLSATSTAPS